MTAVKDIEEEMRRVEGLALIGELAAGIAHEIRNPLASISGSIQILREGLRKEDFQNRLMDIVLREINRLNLLINDFLLFARPRKARPQSFDLNRMIQESLELFRNSDHWKDRINVETQFHRDIHLQSDPEQIRQVLWNLFLNAVEAMPAGGTLRVTTELVDHRECIQSSDNRVKIVVSDTGNGFDQPTLSELFTPFFTTKENGCGLGLAIVRRIVKGLHGEISGDNRPEKGAEMTIFLPVSLS
jgi:two-component system sensor histidine kinase PilS (NtrC family)